MNIFIINGHKYYPYSEGRLNNTMFEEIVSILTPNNDIKTSILENGYDVNEEIEKFKWADLIIIQTPVNWFSLPWLLKKYVDEVYAYGIFYTGSKEYGKGGLLNGKSYMYSLTMNSPEAAFEDTSGFFDGRCVDDIIIAQHKVQQFCGLTKIKTFSLYDVVHNPDILSFKNRLREHLDKYILMQGNLF